MKGLDYSHQLLLEIYKLHSHEVEKQTTQIVSHNYTFGGKSTKIVGTIDMTDLSGTLTAPTTRAIVLSDKNITYDISEDLFGKTRIIE